MEIIKDNLFWFIFFGSIFIITLVRIVTGKTNFMRSKFEQKIAVTPIVNIDETLLEAMKKAGFKNLNHQSPHNRIDGTVPFSMSSWSEIIEVKWQSIDDKLEIQFQSVCSMPYQIYDWGKNKENFKRFHNELMKVI